MNVVCAYALSISIIFTSSLPRLAYSQEEIILPDMGDSAGAVISREQERKLGKKFITEFRRVAPIVDDYEIEDYWIEVSHEESLHPHNAVARVVKGISGGFQLV